MNPGRKLVALSSVLPLAVACSSSSSGGAPPADGGNDGRGSTHIAHVIVIAMENHDEGSIYGSADAPYISGTLVPSYASASNFVDPLPLLIPSEPHYVYMEAGTATFPDRTFIDDSDPSAANSTSSTAHLSTQLDAAGLGWMAYQEGIDATTGACPIHASGFYMPKHDPFVFFQDVSGNPPSDTNERCAAHHLGIDAFWEAVAGQMPMPSYAFVTPNQCNDMHGQGGCPESNLVRSGDDWLAARLPDVIAYAEANQGVIFLVWDEGETDTKIPFLAIGPHVKKGYVSDSEVTHGSLVKSVEKIFDLPVLDAVAPVNDFGDFFEGGAFP